MMWFVLLLVYISFIDLKYKIVPNKLIIPMTIAILIARGSSGMLVESCLGLVSGILLVFLMNSIGMTKLGGGDAKLLGMIGALFNMEIVLPVALLAFLISKLFRYRPIAYAPFICIATLMVILWTAV